MATASNVLFSWADVEKLPELRRLELVLDTLPDQELVATLEAARGRGRDDDPVRAMWRALIAGVVFGHRSIASLLRELGRNPALLAACGFDPLPRQSRPRTVLERDAQRSRVVYSTPYGSPSWKRGYNRRSALERINNRLDHAFEFEQHFIRGLARMRTRVGVALAVMMALALGHLRAGRPESMRSLFAADPFADTG